MQGRTKVVSIWKWGILLLGLGISLAAESASPAKAEPALTLSSAINKAGRQRMLSQRIVKAYCQIGLKVQADKAKVILDNSVSLFDSQLAELKPIAVKPEIQEALAKEAALWGEFRPLAAAPAGREGAKKLMELSESLLLAANKVTQLLENELGTRSGKLVNLAGRQRMLSQRLAKFYMLRKWGFSQPEVVNGIEQAKREFASAQQELAAASQNTPAIRQELELAKTQWIFFENALAQHDASEDSVYASNVATTSERILEVMDRVTGLYEKVEGN